MRQHSTDLFALLVGLAFAIAGTGVIISQSTDSGLSGRASAATGLILLGAVALAVTLARTFRDPSHAYADAQPRVARGYAGERTSPPPPPPRADDTLSTPTTNTTAETAIGETASSDLATPGGDATDVSPEDPTG